MHLQYVRAYEAKTKPDNDVAEEHMKRLWLILLLCTLLLRLLQVVWLTMQSDSWECFSGYLVTRVTMTPPPSGHIPCPASWSPHGKLTWGGAVHVYVF